MAAYNKFEIFRLFIVVQSYIAVGISKSLLPLADRNNVMDWK